MKVNVRLGTKTMIKDYIVYWKIQISSEETKNVAEVKKFYLKLKQHKIFEIIISKTFYTNISFMYV